MEILSIGEKIKRTRIYKGYTLKDICGDKISISKMSCIENGKIIPEDWVMKLVAEKLDIDVNYLKKDVKEQLEENYKEICNNAIKPEYEKILKYNLEFAQEYKYYTIAVDIMHLLFNYYLDLRDINACQINTSKYYNLCVKSKRENDRLMYYLDIGRYLYMGNEYFQAASYYNNVKKELLLRNSKNYNMIAEAIYKEAECYLLICNYESAYEIIIKFMQYIPYLNEEKYASKIYNLVAIICVKVGNDKHEEYEKNSLELCKGDVTKKAKFLYKYGAAMIETKLEENAYGYICNAVDLYPEKDKLVYVNFMIDVIETLISIGKLDKAQEITDKILNYAIDLKNDMFIEKAYYFKAVTMGNSGLFEMKEMYLSLSLDILMKLGTKSQIYKRYLDMGNLYSTVNKTVEALNYFSLAINLGKKL
jgi:transcriptional regulator with XRE-family HTH domain